MNYREWIQRWRFGRPLPNASIEKKVDHIIERLANLERTLDVLHGLTEWPRPSTAARISATGNTSITSTIAADITGATVDFMAEVDCSLVVNSVFDVTTAVLGATTHVFLGSLVVDGVAQTPLATGSATSAGDRFIAAQTYVITGLTAGVTYTIKLQARTSNAATQFTAFSGHTGFSYCVFPGLFKL